MSMEPLPVRLRRTLRLGPVETLAVARRQIDALVSRRIDRARATVVPRLARLGTGRGDALATYFAVPDGHTLNLQAALPPLGELAGVTAEVVFRRGRREHRAPATLRAGLVEAAVVLGALPGRLPLDVGGWRVRVVLTRPSGRRHRLAVHRLTPPPQHRGPTIADPRCPDTGARFRAAVSALGACRIVVRPARAGAEVARLAVEPGRAEIVGRLIATGPAGGAVAEFRRHGDGAVRTAPVVVRDGLFHVETPLTGMVPAPGAEDVWEVRVRLPGGGRVPVGRFLHDLASVRRTLRGYERQMLVPGVPLFHLRPQYSHAGRLTLTFTRMDLGEPV